MIRCILSPTADITSLQTLLYPIKTCSYLSSKMSDNPSLIMLSTATVLAWVPLVCKPIWPEAPSPHPASSPQPDPAPRCPPCSSLLCPTPPESHHHWPHEHMLLALYPVWRPLAHSDFEQLELGWSKLRGASSVKTH